MLPALERFKEVRAAKAAAKQISLAAVGEAKLAELHGEDASAHWATVAQYGNAEGREGRYAAEMQEQADDLVKQEPALFADYEMYAAPDAQVAKFPSKAPDGRDELVTGHDIIVRLIDSYRILGNEEKSLLLMMFELARFNRQQIGSAAAVTLRGMR